MTGRDLIIYILANGLENESVIQNGSILGFMTVAEAAEKMNVGFASIFAMIDLNVIDGMKIGNMWFVSSNSIQEVLDKK